MFQVAQHRPDIAVEIFPSCPDVRRVPARAPLMFRALSPYVANFGRSISIFQNRPMENLSSDIRIVALPLLLL